MLSDQRPKPALLYAEILWKIEAQILCPVFGISLKPKQKSLYNMAKIHHYGNVLYPELEKIINRSVKNLKR